MSTVTFNGMRLTDGNSNTGYSKLNAGGGAPSAEPQLAYRKPNVVNVKATNTGNFGGLEYAHGSTVDMTGAANPLFFAKGTVADAGDLNATYGAQFLIGSSDADHYAYNVSGSGANNDQYTAGYSSQGGLAANYLITAINPTVAQWREATTGSPVLTAADYLAFAAQFVNGAAKTENLGFGPIDVGVGLDYTGTNFTFQDGVDTDQGTTSNRWGAACENGGIISLRGKHRVGAGGVATSGIDTSTVLFPDGYHGTGDAGIECDTSSGQTYGFAGTYTGLGRLYGSDDTRPDFTSVGAGTGAIPVTGTFNNWCLIELNAAHTVNGGATLECREFTQGGATVQDATLRFDPMSGVAACDDADFTKLSNVDIVQIGAGHAFEDTGSPGARTVTNIDFVSFGGTQGDNLTPNSGPLDAAYYNNTGGHVDLNVSNVTGMSVRNGPGATTAVVGGQATVTFTGLATGGEFRIYDDDGDANPITIGTNREGTESLTGPSYILTHPTSESGNIIYAQFIDPLNFEEKVIEVTLATTNQTVDFDLTPEENI